MSAFCFRRFFLLNDVQTQRERLLDLVLRFRTERKSREDILGGKTHLIEFQERKDSGKDGTSWIQESNSRAGSSADLMRWVKACRN